MRSRSIAGVVGGLLLLLPLSIHAQERGRKPNCQYQIRFDERLNFTEPLRLSGRKRTGSITFYTERARIPAAGSEIHLLIRHSADLDSTRSFISVSLNYGLLRSLRLDYDDQTEVVIPVPADLLKEKNELLLSVQHFSPPGNAAPEMWTEIDEASFILVRCEQGTPALDLTGLPYPLLDPHANRVQRLNVLVPERTSTPTLEATALLVANLYSRTSRSGSRFDSIKTISSLRGVNEPVLIVGTPREQPQLAQLEHRLPASANFETLLPSEGLAALVTRRDTEINPILIVSGESAAGVLRAARGLFDVRSEVPVSVARIGPPAIRVTETRSWRGFVPPSSRFSLQDMEADDVRIRPGARGAAVIPLDATPDARFLNYGFQARLFFDLRPASGSDHSFLEVFLNDRSLGRFAVRDVSTGSKASLRVNAPGHLLRNRNVFKVLWDTESGDMDGEGWLLRSSEFYLPRYYSAELPDLSLLREHFYPFSLKPDLSDTVIVMPDAIDEDIYATLIELSAHLGALLPSDSVSFTLRRNSENAKLTGTGSHFIILDIQRGQPTVQEMASPWDPQKYVLRMTAGTSAALRQLADRFFSEGIFNRLEGDTFYLAQSQPVMRRVAPPQSIEEHFYLTRIEAWLRSNWLALPLILVAVSVLMFIALRLALNQYRMRSNGAV